MDGNVVNNIIQAISILNKTDEYLESLNDRLSEYDSLNSDFQHFIEFTDIDNINLKELFLSMQYLYKKRRQVKHDMTIQKYYRDNINKLQNAGNRELLISALKKAEEVNNNQKYTNRVMQPELVDKITHPVQIVEKRKRGRPKKEGLKCQNVQII